MMNMDSDATNADVWTEHMYKCLREVALEKQTFTNDDVFEHYEKYVLNKVPVDNRRHGSVVKQAIKDGIIEWTGKGVVSRRKNCNKMLIRVWQSKIYQPKWSDYNVKYVTEPVMNGFPYKRFPWRNPNWKPNVGIKDSWWQRFKKKYFDEVW